MAQNEQDQGFTHLPGTGGDFIDSQDVEGHRVPRQFTGDEVEDLGRNPRIPSADGDDVEGHRGRLPFAGDGSPDELYTSRPTGQGEIIMRGPETNPHGER